MRRTSDSLETGDNPILIQSVSWRERKLQFNQVAKCLAQSPDAVQGEIGTGINLNNPRDEVPPVISTA